MSIIIIFNKSPLSIYEMNGGNWRSIFFKKKKYDFIKVSVNDKMTVSFKLLKLTVNLGQTLIEKEVNVSF